MVKVCAHRGARKHYPENTLPAVQKAIELGVEMIEIDVYATKDHHVVVSHDRDLFRVFGKKGIILELTLAEIRTYQEPKMHIPVPLLSEVLDLMKNSSVLLNIELKASDTEASCIQMVKDRNLQSQILYSSFQLPLLQTIKTMDPQARVCYLTGNFPPDQLSARIAGANQIHAEYMNMNYKTLTKPTVQHVIAAGFKIMAWTVDWGWTMRRMIHLGVDTIITNDPEKLQHILKKM
jgi:glycerophosphoryl diester phosphodiesterase